MGASDTVPDLKHLKVVPQYAGVATGIVERTYTTARSFTPGFVEEYVKVAETTFSKYSAPYVTYLQDTGTSLLKNADQVVDKGLTTTSGVFDASKKNVDSALAYSTELHQQNLNKFTEAREKYFQWVEDRVKYVKQTLSPSALAQTAADQLQQLLDFAKSLTDPDVAVETVHKGWLQFSSIPIVSKTLQLASPALQTSEKLYGGFHDVVVKNKTYKWAFDTTSKTVAQIPETQVFKAVKEVVYPPVAGYVEPVYEKFQKSKYVDQLYEHLKPVV